jgi:hypothetical protein
LQSDRKYASSGRCCALPLTLTTYCFFLPLISFLIFGFGYNSITKVSFSTKSYQGYGGSILKKAQDTKNHPAGADDFMFWGLALLVLYLNDTPPARPYGWTNA